MGNYTDSHKSHRLSRLWQKYVGRFAIGLLGEIPSSIGRRLRNMVYRPFFAELGTGVVIRPGVEFLGFDRISMGDRISLHRGVRLRRMGPHSCIQIGDRVTCDKGVDIKSHGKGAIEIGARTYFGPYTCLSGSKLKIGSDCLIASHCGIYANNHNFGDPNRKINQQGNSYKGISIEENCWLGTGVRVVDGVTIGTGSVIGAGAVVTKNIPPYSIAVGVPAKVVGQRQPSNVKDTEDTSHLTDTSQNSLDRSMINDPNFDLTLTP
ncbi:MAG: acyltransferase [Elainellaceae cyanobacterium]